MYVIVIHVPVHVRQAPQLQLVRLEYHCEELGDGLLLAMASCVVFNQVLLYTTVYYCILLYTTVYCCILLYTTVYYCIPGNSSD